MSVVHRTRVGLIRFAKIFPFFLCFLVAVSLSECAIALINEDYLLLDGSLTPNTPISWFLASNYEIGIYSVIAAIILSVAFETCIWNKLSNVFLLVYLKEQTYFPTVELYKEQIAVILAVNIIICMFFIYKGIKTLW